MRKTWVKRDSIYYKPFYKQKFKLLLFIIFLLAIIFFCYQAFYINQLPSNSTPISIESSPQFSSQEPSLLIIQKLNSAAGIGGITEKNEEIQIIRGIRLKHFNSYKPNFDGKFKCLTMNIEIDFKKVNDDYCDCPDGSDEPSTNACPNGQFYCKYQKRHITGRGRDISIPSNRINDGICDCCDGSDEWLLINNIKCENHCS